LQRRLVLSGFENRLAMYQVVRIDGIAHSTISLFVETEWRAHSVIFREIRKWLKRACSCGNRSVQTDYGFVIRVVAGLYARCKDATQRATEMALPRHARVERHQTQEYGQPVAPSDEQRHQHRENVPRVVTPRDR
jgi:hypothetical protein